MTSTLLVSDLKRALTAVYPAVNASTGIPILKCVRMSPGQVAATNMNITATAALLDSSIDAAVPAAALRSVVDALAPDAKIDLTLDAKIDLTLDAKAGLLTAKSGRSTSTLSVMPAADYPELPAAATEGPSITLGDEAHRELMEVAGFSSNDDTRPVLTGVHIEWKPDGARFSATDSYQLGVWRGEVESLGAADVIVPAAALRAMPKDGDALVLTVAPGGDTVTLRRGATTVVVRVIEGQFPNVDQLIPHPEVEVKITPEAIEEIGRLVKTLGDTARHPIRLTFTPESTDLGVHLVASEEGITRRMETALAEPYPGKDEMVCGYNPRYLSHVLGYGDGTIGLIGPLRPLSVGGSIDQPGRVGLLMPIRVSE